jgi:tetratricopeptide (TPR) repeat protein
MRLTLLLFVLIVNLDAGAGPMELPDAIYEKVTELSDAGNRLAEDGKYRDAVSKFIEALELLPEPITDWEACTWLLTAIGDTNFLAGNYEQARKALSDAMHCPGAIGNPFIHMRLGQSEFELGNTDRAADELARAYLQEGLAIFEDEDPKYVAFVKSKLKPPPGGWPPGW